MEETGCDVSLGTPTTPAVEGSVQAKEEGNWDTFDLIGGTALHKVGHRFGCQVVLGVGTSQQVHFVFGIKWTSGKKKTAEG